MDKIKKIFNITDKEAKNCAFLQGIIISMYSKIKELEKENQQLKVNVGVWLSPEKIEEHNRIISNLLIKENK